MVFSFLISQNNNIPRIKKAVNTISERLGDKKEFMGHTYYAFPSVEKICAKDESFFKECGLGYRAEYVKIVANELKNGMLNKIYNFNENDIKQELIKIKGIGEKVADCICLFGLYKTRSFPVDVWIEKIYRENFNGKLTNRKQITNYFVDQFGYDAGYFQQYLFYYKRSLEK